MIQHEQQILYILSILHNQTKDLHYNGSNSFLFVDAAKLYQCKAKNFEVKDYVLCLGNIFKTLILPLILILLILTVF